MIKKIAILLLFLTSTICSHADINDYKASMTIEEEDGVPSGRPRTLKVSNGDLTDNGDRTFSLKTASAVTETDPLSLHLDGSNAADYITVNQTADSRGIIVNGYDDMSGVNVGMYVDSMANTWFKANSALVFDANSGINQLYFEGSAYNFNSLYSQNAVFKFYGLTDSGNRYVGMGIESDDYWHMGRQDSSILGMKWAGLALDSDAGARFAGQTLLGGVVSPQVSGGTGGIDADTKLYVKFDGVNGAQTAPDETGVHTLTFVGTAQLSNLQKAYAGDGTSLLLDGNSDYITIPDSASWDIFKTLSEDWTVDFWVRHKDHVGDECYFSKSLDNNNRFLLRHRHGTGLYLYMTDRGELFFTGGEISDTNWHHITLVKKGGVASAEYGGYIDGVQTLYGSSSAYEDSITGLLRIGDELVTGSNTNYFDGNIAHFRIQKSNIFSASPNVGKTDTITVPTAPYSASIGNTDVNIHAIGTTANPTPTWLTSDSLKDLYIEGKLEVDDKIYADGGLDIISDSKGLTLGAASDATLLYNGTNLVINPKAVGSGLLSILGDISLLDEDIVLGTTTGTKFGTDTAQKIGFYNATPVVQQIATTDLGVALSNLGLRAAGTAYPITTSGAVTFTNAYVGLKSDSSILKFGAADDATIQFDGNSLNIVANAVTATDDLLLTGRYIGITGNVGIGTTAPTEALHVIGNTLVNGNITCIGSNRVFGIDGTTNAYLDIDRGATSYLATVRYKTDGTNDWWAGLADSDIYGDGTNYFIGTSASTTGGAKLVILTNGRVGIGTVTPSQLLHVNGIIEADDKIIFTQADGNEYIDSLADGYMDYGATTQHRFNNDVDVDGDITGDNLSGDNTGDQTFTTTIGITVDGGGSVPDTGLKGYFRVPYTGTIKSVNLVADKVGSVVFDIWKDTTVPTVADTITAAAKPTLDSAQTYEDTTLTGWTTAVTAGDYIAYNVDSVSTLNTVTLILEIEQ